MNTSTMEDIQTLDEMFLAHGKPDECMVIFDYVDIFGENGYFQLNVGTSVFHVPLAYEFGLLLNFL